MRRTRRVAILIVACVALLVIGGGALAFNARMANHFGYALPEDTGLPSRIAFAGRHYSSAGDCWSSSRLQREGAWPLHAVSQLPTLLGPAHPVLSAPVPQGMTTMLLLVPSGACYTVYSLEGGS
jgi:hypothetical protein